VASSIPFRFKAGGSGNGNMAPENHHHRSTTKQSKKGFKSRHATKSALKEVSKGMDADACAFAPARALTVL
jgi:pre-rRNA-processing protein TSR1